MTLNRCCAKAWRVAALTLGALLGCYGAHAASLNDLVPGRSYQTAAIVFMGNHQISDDQLQAVMQTKTRPFYEIWKARPPFDPNVFTADLGRLQRIYQVNGYYQARVNYHLTINQNLLNADITLAEGERTTIAAITLAIEDDAPQPAALDPQFKLPLTKDGPFDQAAYQLGEQQLLSLYQRHGYAFASASRRAQVYAGPSQAYIWYTVTPGARGVFGATIVKGGREVTPDLVLRELTYRKGDPFDASKIATSRQNVLKLNLFSSVQFVPHESRSHRAVFPIIVEVREKSSRELNLTLGYNTETLFNASLCWNYYNWLGGGRQLLLSGTYSNVRSNADAKLIQPYLLSRNTRGILEAILEQQTYQTYELKAERLLPRIDYFITPQLTTTFGWRLGYLQFNSLAASTIAALGGVRRQGILSGPAVSLIDTLTDDPLNPQHGAILSFAADVADRMLGSDYKYWRTVGEARHYQLLGWQTVLASRFRLGLADTFGPARDIPLSDRYYSGGEGSVRGYGLRRIGRLSAANDPLGGLSLVEGSVELRRPLYWKISGAAFFDCGQVSTHPFRIPVDALQCGLGPALSVTTPVGPVRIDLGFPTKRPKGDSSWQVYFSIGQFY